MKALYHSYWLVKDTLASVIGLPLPAVALAKAGVLPTSVFLKTICFVDVRTLPILCISLPVAALAKAGVLRSPDFGLRSPDFGLPTSVFGLPTSVFRLPTSVLLSTHQIYLSFMHLLLPFTKNQDMKGIILSIIRIDKIWLPDKITKHSMDMTPVISPREKEVLFLIAQENTSEEIAQKLFVSSHTAKTHRKNLLEKLEAKTWLAWLGEALSWVYSLFRAMFPFLAASTA